MKNTDCIQEYYDQIKLLWKDITPVTEKTKSINHSAEIDMNENPLNANLLGYCFNAILGFEVCYRPFEKINYAIRFDYKGTCAHAVDRKMEYVIILEKSAKAEFIEILKETKPILNKILQCISQESLERNEFTLINHFRQYKDKLSYDEEKIDKLYELQRIYENEGHVIISFIDNCQMASQVCEEMGWRPNIEWRRLTYEIEAYINDYYSYLEHLLTLLIPFSPNFDSSKPYKETWTKGWIKKIEMVWGKDAVDYELFEELKRYKEVYRNRNAHGLFSRETKAYIQIPELGRYLMGIGNHYLKGFMDDGDVYLSINTYQEFKKSCRQFEGFVYNTYPIAMVFIERGLNIPVHIMQEIENIHTVEEANEMVDKILYCLDRAANMDW